MYAASFPPNIENLVRRSTQLTLLPREDKQRRQSLHHNDQSLSHKGDIATFPQEEKLGLLNNNTKCFKIES